MVRIKGKLYNVFKDPRHDKFVINNYSNINSKKRKRNLENYSHWIYKMSNNKDQSKFI